MFELLLQRFVIRTFLYTSLKTVQQDSRSIPRCSDKDQERKTKIQKLVDKLQAGYQTKSIINDLEKRETCNTFSEASRCTIKELGNIDLYELGEISKTVQCQTCLRCWKDVQRTPHRTHGCAHFFHCGFLHVTARVAQDCCESSENPFIVGHVVVEHSFDPISSYFLFTCDLTDNTHCHTYAINWKQTTTLRYFAGEGPNTSYEPKLAEKKFCIDIDSEHTPINLPRGMIFPQEYAATIIGLEDLNLPRHPGPSSSSQHSAASRIPTLSKLCELGTSATMVMANRDFVVGNTSKKGNLRGHGSWNSCFKSFRFCVKEEERSRPKRCANIKKQAKSSQFFEREAELAVKGEKLAQQKLYEGKADVKIIRRINGLTKLKETISLYGELEMSNRLFREHQAKDWQEIEELKRTYCEEIDRARQARIDELSMQQERNPTRGAALERPAFPANSLPFWVPERALELMGHVAIHFKWTGFSFHRGYSCNLKSILDAGLIAGAKKSKEGRQTLVHSIGSLGEWDWGKIRKPRKVRYETKWDAVFWFIWPRHKKRD